MDDGFTQYSSNDPDFNIEGFLNALADLFAHRGDAVVVAVLSDATGLVRQCDYDNWDGGTYIYQLVLTVSRPVYGQIHDAREELEKRIAPFANEIFAPGTNDYLKFVRIVPSIGAEDPEWREKSKAWLTGAGMTNQGRVRSENIAAKECDGLLFRSNPEIYLYKALKSKGVPFAPLPVFIKGGPTYKRIEPDFIVIKDGIMLHIEIDGDTVHIESPAEAHERTAMLQSEGVHVERFKSSRCSTEKDAMQLADQILEIISQRKRLR